MPTQGNEDSMAACARPTLFSIPELVYTVFLHLSVGDLLRVQRVCRLWKELTDRSPTLQRHLFFLPVSNTDQAPEFNPLLREVFSPLIPEYNNEKDAPYTSSVHPEDLCKQLNWYQDEYLRRHVLSPEASWRRMFPVQPPPAQIEGIYVEGGCSCFYQLKKGVIRDHFQHLQERGVTMGFLWDVAIHVLNDQSQSDPAFFFYWHMFPFLPDVELGGGEYERWVDDFGPRRNAVTITVDLSSECYPRANAPYTLNVGYFDPEIIDWDNEYGGGPAGGDTEALLRRVMGNGI